MHYFVCIIYNMSAMYLLSLLIETILKDRSSTFPKFHFSQDILKNYSRIEK